MLHNLDALNNKKGSYWKNWLAFTIIIIPGIFSDFLPAFFENGLYKFGSLLYGEYIQPSSTIFGFDDKDLIEYDLKKYLIEKLKNL